MDYEDKILVLFKNGYLKTSDVTKSGIPRIYLTKMVNAGKIERVCRGIYAEKDILTDEFVILQNKSKYAIYSNTTALYLYGFSDRVPIKYDITVNSGYRGSLQEDKRVCLFYTDKKLLDLGVSFFKLHSGNVIRVYDLDKTICDIIKNRSKIDAEIFNKAIRMYFYSNEKNTLKLYEYAKKMNIYKKVRDVFLVFS